MVHIESNFLGPGPSTGRPIIVIAESKETNIDIPAANGFIPTWVSKRSWCRVLKIGIHSFIIQQITISTLFAIFITKEKTSFEFSKDDVKMTKIVAR